MPLSMTIQKKNISYVPCEFEASIADKKRLQPNEEKLALLRKIQRYTTHIVGIDDLNNDDSYKISV